MRHLALVVLVGCTHAPRIAWGVRDDRATLADGGTCAATLRVRVVDGGGAPVSGATVVMRQQMRMNAPSTVPVHQIYETVPVVTDARGEAQTCGPASVPPHHGEQFFTYYDGGTIVARLGTREATLSAPFAGPVVVR